MTDLAFVRQVLEQEFARVERRIRLRWQAPGMLILALSLVLTWVIQGNQWNSRLLWIPIVTLPISAALTGVTLGKIWNLRRDWKELRRHLPPG